MKPWVVLWCLLFVVVAPQASASAWTWGTYSDAVTAAQPELYWRLGEIQGTTIADASTHGHTATLASPAQDRTKPGALVGDADSALGGGVVYYGSSYDLIRLPAPTGLPTGDRTVEAWVWADNPGARLVNYSDFVVDVDERALVVSGVRLSLPPDDTRRLTDSRWHHVAVTYTSGTLTAYLDGAPFAMAAKTLNTKAGGDLLAARIPAGANVAYDELALYPTALDVSTIAAHFAASGNAKPVAPASVQADAKPNGATVSWPAVSGPTPAGQPAVDHYVVEAWHGATLETAQAVTGLTATLSGLPAGSTRFTVRALSGFGSGPSAAVDVDVPGEASTYASTIVAAQPSVYWRLSDSGTLVSDSSGHGRTAAFTAAGKSATGALANDGDKAVGAGVVYYGSSYDLIRAPIATGLPTGDRTLEAWIWSDNAGARVINYGDFSVAVEERAIVVSGTRLSLAPDDDRRLTDARWHQIAVTYASGTLTAYLDGQLLASAAKTLATTNTGELLAARIPAGANVRYDELALYDRALDAATVAAHFAASANSRPAAPTDVSVGAAAGAFALYWTPPTGATPAGQSYIDHYVLEAREDGVMRGAKSIAGTAQGLNLTGLPSGHYTLTVRAINGFGEGTVASVEADMGDESTTYAGAVTDDSPELYWRLGDASGTLVTDASGHGHQAAYAKPVEQRSRLSALAHDPDNAVQDGVVYYGSSYDLIRAPLAAGLPTGDRTVEAWVWSDNPGARVINYGDFSVEVAERGLITGGTHLDLPAGDNRRLTDSRWHQIAVTYSAGTVTAYLDGKRFATAGKTFTTVTTGELLGARIPAGANVRYDDISLYGHALDAAAIAAHFAASANQLPPLPANLYASTADNVAALSWSIPNPFAASPPGQNVTDNVIVEAWQGDTLRAAQATPSSSVTLTGLPAGDYRFVVRALGAFGEGPPAEITGTVTGVSSTYASTVEGDKPAMYWRLGEYAGTLLADSSGHDHRALYAANHVHTGALPNDPDAGTGAGVVYYGSSYDLIRAPLAAGMPTGERTVEAWVWSDNPGARLINYGDFSVALEERAIVVSGVRISLGDTDTRRITDAHWHQIAVTYKDGTVTAYLDGAPLGSTAKTLTTVNTGELLAARIPAGANVVYDDLAVYDKALDAGAIAAHFAASGNAFPSAPEQLSAETSDNSVTATWTAPTVSAPPGQRPIDHYVVEAWQGTTLRAAQAVDAARHTATLSGLPAGATSVRVRAVNGFAAGPDATKDATVPGAASTYAGAVTNAAPQLYWRLGERSGTLVADTAGTHPAAYSQPADQRTLPSGMTSDPDSSVGAGVVYYGSSYDLIRAPLAAGLPTGNRTVEAFVWADAPGAQILSYGGFSVAEEARGLAVGTTKLTLPADDDRKLTDSKWHHIALTYDGATLTFYLDGEAVASAPATLTTTATGDLLAARIPAGANVRYDELAVYDKVLDAATIAAHYALSGNPAPVDRKAPKPTIDALSATNTRPKLSGRLGELPGDLPTVTVRITKDGSQVLQRDLAGVSGAWSFTPPVLPTGDLVLTVTQADQAGNIGSASSTWTVTNTASDASLALDATDGPLPLTVHATVTGSDADSDPLTYRLDFGDGGVVTGTLPIAPVAHVYTRVGTFPVTLTVNDGTATVTKTASVTTRLAEPLKADAGDDQVVEAGQPLTFDGRASRPSVGIEHYHWTFGDGGQADGAVVSHTFAAQGAQTAKLEITAGSATSSDTAAITVLPQSPAVTVTVTSGGHAVGGADVLAILADGRRIAGTAGGDGKAKLDRAPRRCPDDLRVGFRHAPRQRHGRRQQRLRQRGDRARAGRGRLAERRVAPHDQGRGRRRRHQPRRPEQQPGLQLRGTDRDRRSDRERERLDVPERALGLRRERLAVELWRRRRCLRLPELPGRRAAAAMARHPGAHRLPEGVLQHLDGRAEPRRAGVHPARRHGLARPPVRAVAGADEHPAAGERRAPGHPRRRRRVHSWVVRGDTEGSYEPTARYAATLNPIDLPIALQAKLAAPIQVFGASAMKLVVDTDDRFDDRYPGHVRVGIKNVSPATVSNASLEIPVAGAKGYVAQPKQTRAWTVPSIAPGRRPGTRTARRTPTTTSSSSRSRPATST